MRSLIDRRVGTVLSPMHSLANKNEQGVQHFARLCARRRLERRSRFSIASRYTMSLGRRMHRPGRAPPV